MFILGIELGIEYCCGGLFFLLFFLIFLLETINFAQK